MSLAEDAGRLLQRAKEYELLADAMPDEPTPPPPMSITVPMQQPQQGPATDDQDDKENKDG